MFSYGSENDLQVFLGFNGHIFNHTSIYVSSIKIISKALLDGFLNRRKKFAMERSNNVLYTILVMDCLKRADVGEEFHHIIL